MINYPIDDTTDKAIEYNNYYTIIIIEIPNLEYYFLL